MARQEPPLPPAGFSMRAARGRFSELLRRAEEEKERIRLTRRGKPIAYVVPLEDVERLREFDEAAARGESPSPKPPQGLLQSGPADASYNDEDSAGEAEDESYGAMPAEPSPHDLEQYDEESLREQAAADFTRGLHKIFADREPLQFPEMARRLKSDGYLGTTIRRLLGEKR